MIMIAIVLIIVLVVLFFSLRFLIKDMRKNYNAMDENIKSIENKMAELRTVEDCTQLQKEIASLYNGTDSILKGIRSEYEKRYYMVLGIKYALENKIGRYEKNRNDIR